MLHYYTEKTCGSEVLITLANTKRWTNKFAFAHVQFEQSPLQWHLISSWQALETSGMVIQTGIYVHDDLVQENSSGEGISCICVAVVQIPAWYNDYLVYCSRASWVGGNLSIDRFLLRNNSSLTSFTRLNGLVLS